MKKIVLCIIVFFISLHFLEAQSIYPSIKTTSNVNPGLIEEAVKDVFFIIRQGYQLKDVSVKPPKYYGRDNNPFFGFTYSLGIKTTTGFYTDEKVLRPWDYDSNYDSYRTNKSYEPVLSGARYRSFYSDNLQEMTFVTDSCATLSKPFVHVKNTKIFNGKGFSTEVRNGIQNGWLVWVVLDKPLETIGSVGSFLVLNPHELQLESSQKTYEMPVPSVERNKIIAGGIYIVPVASAGQISYQLVGLISESDNKWYLQKITGVLSEITTAKEKKETSAPTENKDGLTPVENNENDGTKNIFEKIKEVFSPSKKD
ncbi:MAG: hypothetical protein LBS88_01535 [Tannerellaceae bacterium]|nr:hypothetical protein [Tannerellaceae bacterium]